MLPKLCCRNCRVWCYWYMQKCHVIMITLFSLNWNKSLLLLKYGVGYRHVVYVGDSCSRKRAWSSLLKNQSLAVAMREQDHVTGPPGVSEGRNTTPQIDQNLKINNWNKLFYKLEKHHTVSVGCWFYAVIANKRHATKHVMCYNHTLYIWFESIAHQQRALWNKLGRIREI